jgi:O-antigen ligase
MAALLTAPLKPAVWRGPGPTAWLAAALAVLAGVAAVELGTKALLLTAALPVALALLAQPRWAFWLLVAALPVTVELGAGITVSRVVVPLVVLSVLLNALLGRCAFPNPLASTPARVGLAFFMVAALAWLTAAGWSPGMLDPELRSVEANANVTRLVIFMLTLSLVRTPEDARGAIRVLVVAATLEALLVVAQVKLRFVLPGNWRASAMGNVAESAGDFRADGTTAHPIYLAGYLQMVMPFAAAMLWRGRPLLRLVGAAVLALLVYAWAAAVSRSSMLGLAAMAVVALCLWTPASRALVIALAVGFVLALAAHGWSLSALSVTVEQFRNFGRGLSADQLTSSSGALQFRLESTLGGWNLFLAHPLTGVGLGQVRHHYMAYLPEWAHSPFHPVDIHNVFTAVAAESGGFALLLLLALWVLALRGLHRAWRDPALRPIAGPLLVALVGQLVFVSLTPMVREMWFTLALACALGLQARARAAGPHSPEPMRTAP